MLVQSCSLHLLLGQEGQLLEDLLDAQVNVGRCLLDDRVDGRLVDLVDFGQRERSDQGQDEEGQGVEHGPDAVDKVEANERLICENDQELGG